MSTRHVNKIQFAFFFMVIFLAASLTTGCSKEGDKGATGPAGPAGPAGPTGSTGAPGLAAVDLSTMTLSQQAELGSVSMDTESISITIGGPPQITFTLVDDFGRPVMGMDSVVKNIDDRAIRFTLAQLENGSHGEPDFWSNYVTDSNGIPTYDSVRGGGTLSDNGDGTYTYTFATDVGDDPAYDPTATSRLAGQIGSSDLGFKPTNFVYDFVPNGSPVTHTHNVAMTASCNECHDPLTVHGRRFDVGYCVTCHNPALKEDGDSYNLGPMVHMIHSANPDFRGGDFADVTYPQDLRNCRKCHSGEDAATPQGDNWKTVQTPTLCFKSCHGVPDSLLERAAFHTIITSDCGGCHNNQIVAKLDIEKIHTTTNATENNPGLPAGERKIEYSITRAALNGANVVINFRVLSDGTSLDLTNLPTDLAGPGRWPGFIFAYALPQDGIAAPADFNNLGNAAGQPTAVSLEDLANGSDGTLSFTNGTCTATLPNPFPAGARMRTVGLQGYFQQDLNGEVISLHTRSVVTTLAGDTPRRPIADSFGCAQCHEIFEGHGGNRVFTADGGVQICTMCHNPNLSSSGRSIDPADAVGSSAAADLGTSDTSTWPEATNNFKDLIHGIHASAFRNTDYQFVRGRNNGIYYNWSDVTFPGNLADCKKCHLDDSYLPGNVPESALMSTDRTTGQNSGMDQSFTDVVAARDSVPNATDWVITPVAAACYACHDGKVNKSHMELNGAAIDENRDLVSTIDTCAICHGSGNIADVKTEHGLE